MNDGGDKNCLNVSFLSSLFIEKHMFRTQIPDTRD